MLFTIETDKRTFLGDIEVDADQGVLTVRTGLQGRSPVLFLEDVVSVTPVTPADLADADRFEVVAA